MDMETQVFQWMGRTPWMLVAMSGVVLCMVFGGRYPRRCLLIGSALGIKLAISAAGPFISSFIFSSFDASDMSELKWRMLLNGLLYSIPDAIALGLLLWVAFEPMWQRDRSGGQSG